MYSKVDQQYMSGDEDATASHRMKISFVFAIDGQIDESQFENAYIIAFADHEDTYHDTVQHATIKLGMAPEVFNDAVVQIRNWAGGTQKNQLYDLISTFLNYV
jgi:hypothetical protein